MKNMLLCLEQCTKCTEAKELIRGRGDIMVITFPHDFDKWTEIQKKFVEKFKVLADLQKTAPIFVDSEGKVSVGFLRIKKWIQDNPEKQDDRSA